MKKNKKVIEDLFVFDAHCDTANVLYDQSSYFIKGEKTHLTLEKAKIGGLNAQIFTIYVNPAYAPHQVLKKGLMLYNALDKKLFSTEYAVKVSSTLEMRSALEQNKFACWVSLESGDIIENSLDILEFFYRLGIRIMILTHNKNTDWADSSGDKPTHDGLTKLGKDIIAKMNKLSMVVDVSHAADKTVEDVLEISSKPIMVSHSCARALCDIPRNISDELITEISHRKGYIGVNFFPGFLNIDIYQQVMNNMEKYTGWFKEESEKNKNNPDNINKVEMELYAKMVEGIDSVNVSSVIEHIAHIIDVGGIDCVGLGSDFDGIPLTPIDLNDVSCYPKLVEGLNDKGFNEQEIRKIMGSNLFHFVFAPKKGESVLFLYDIPIKFPKLIRSYLYSFVIKSHKWANIIFK